MPPLADPRRHDSQDLPFGDDHLERTVSFPAEHVTLEGTLGVPPDGVGIVLFAHGSGSSRFSARNRYVARVLRDAGLGTLLLDLLSRSEEVIDDVTRQLRFDIPMLADRLVAAIDWLAHQPETAPLSVGLFGANTVGGAALMAATARRDRVGAVVSRGGRPDLAGEALPMVDAPTLLLVGQRDEQVIELNERARRQMHAPVALEIIPRATHLFEEPGTLEEVARQARDWFLRYLPEARSSTTAHGGRWAATD
jgi:putative phosphoribosyl transferase